MNSNNIEHTSLLLSLQKFGEHSQSELSLTLQTGAPLAFPVHPVEKGAPVVLRFQYFISNVKTVSWPSKLLEYALSISHAGKYL